MKSLRVTIQTKATKQHTFLWHEFFFSVYPRSNLTNYSTARKYWCIFRDTAAVEIIAVCISGLTSGKPRLTSLKTPVLPRFFAVRNTAVKNGTRWCLNSLLFPLFQRLINFNKRDVARRRFYDVIDFTLLLLLP